MKTGSQVIEMEGRTEEIVSPEVYLNLTPEQKRSILKVRPFIKSLETSDIENSEFVALKIKWKNPTYKAKL